VIRQFLQRQKSSKEVAALLQQHLDVRPVSPVGFSLAVQVLIVLEALFFTFAYWVSFMSYVVLLGVQKRGPGWLALSPQIRLIGGGIFLILSIAAFVFHLRLPVAHPFFSYFAPLEILANGGPIIACLNLAYLSLPLFGYPLNHNAPYGPLIVGGVVGATLSLLFLLLTLRKDTRVRKAQARADLLQTHLELEQIRLTQKHLLKRPKNQKNQTALEKATQADMPRFYLARHPDGTYTVGFKADLPTPIMKRLAEMQPKTAFTDDEAVRRVLEEDAPCEDIWTGKIYTFPEIAAPQPDPHVIGIPITWDRGWEAGEQEDDEEDEEEGDEEERKVISRAGEEWDITLLAYVVNERIVAGCRAQKISDMAAEAWVQPESSNGKEARQVTLAWAATMQRSGKIPFFSHHIDDEGAAGLARGLGLPLVAEEVDYY
jgi:hypothetical protein